MNNLEKVVEEREEEINLLNKQLDNFYDNNVKLENEKGNLEKKVYELSETNHKHVNHIDRLEAENEQQKNHISKQEYVNNTLENDKAKLQARIENLDNELRSTNNKLKQTTENLGNTNRNWDDSKKVVQKLQVS